MLGPLLLGVVGWLDPNSTLEIDVRPADVQNLTKP